MGAPSVRQSSSVTAPSGEVRASARFPSLDGLRGIAVLLVMMGHYLIRTTDGTGFVDRLLIAEPILGVGLFFAISGFLITRLLMVERQTVGRIHLFRFYARRAVRLWPPLWALVAVTVALGAVGLITVHSRDVLGALLFTTDYTTDIAGQHGQYLFHTWSLAIEEQFYLVWPAILLVVGLAGSRKALTVAVVAAPLIRLASYALVPVWRPAADYQFHTRFDALAAGCLLAAYWDEPRLHETLRRYRLPLAVGCVGLICLVEVINAAVSSRAFMLVAGYSIQSFAFAAIVGVAITGAETSGGRVLNGRVLVHLGVISYSLYLWQEMFVLEPFGIFQIVPIGVLAAVACAELSWRTLERPLARARRRLHPRPT